MRSSVVYGAPLSERETQVAELLATGATRPEVAERLKVSLGTIKSQANAIYTKLGVSTQSELCHRVMKARMGVIHADLVRVRQVNDRYRKALEAISRDPGSLGKLASSALSDE